MRQESVATLAPYPEWQSKKKHSGYQNRRTPCGRIRRQSVLPERLMRPRCQLGLVSTWVHLFKKRIIGDVFGTTEQESSCNDNCRKQAVALIENCHFPRQCIMRERPRKYLVEDCWAAEGS